MAKIEFEHPASDHLPGYVETIEARVWALGGMEEQVFVIGSGINFQANGNVWLEIIYSTAGAQVFYTRNFLHHHPYSAGGAASAEARLDEIVQKGEGVFGFGDMFPETSLLLTLEKITYEDSNDEEQQSIHCNLKIATDTGTVFGRTGPGMRFVSIELMYADLEECVRFMRELIHEVDTVQQDRHPDPASFPAGSSEWPFVWQLNRQAYNKISEDYQEGYFENPLLAEAFEGWLAKLPSGGHVLDAGCGHGQPVIARLLDRGFQVTGSDFSPEMLRRASQQFPQAAFLNQTTTSITHQAAFDGACSFNSMLYLDPIDFLNSVYRLHCALKPGGLLFLYAFDSGPDWRGEPLRVVIGQWMWSWHYGMEEAARLLEEHGYFEVLESRFVQVDPKEEQRMAQELEQQKKDEAEYLQQQEESSLPFKMPFLKLPIPRSPYGYSIIAQRCER